MSTETAPPSPDPQPVNHSERLLRAQAAELEALRDRVRDLPDVDQIATWRASHDRLTELQRDLPRWRAELQQAHHAEQSRLEAAVAEQSAALDRAKLDQELQREYLLHGGIAAHFDAWKEIAGKGVSRAEDGSLSIGGQPIGSALTAQRNDSLHGVFFHPRMGAGSGSHSGFNGRVVNTPNLQSMTTGQLFRHAFTPQQRPS